MIELKFRLIKDNNIVGYLRWYNGKRELSNNEDFKVIINQIDYDSLNQYVCSTDKNGQELYIGDILQCSQENIICPEYGNKILTPSTGFLIYSDFNNTNTTLSVIEDGVSELPGGKVKFEGNTYIYEPGNEFYGWKYSIKIGNIYSDNIFLNEENSKQLNKEFKFRLIQNGKIVGYETFKNGKWLYSSEINGVFNENYIVHDAKDYFIGHIDSVGKEIYSNDIMDDGNLGEKFWDNTGLVIRALTGKVIYKCNQGLSLNFDCINMGLVKDLNLKDNYIHYSAASRDGVFLGNWNEMKVIGNIYENKELLVILCDNEDN